MVPENWHICVNKSITYLLKNMKGWRSSEPEPLAVSNVEISLCTSADVKRGAFIIVDGSGSDSSDLAKVGSEDFVMLQLKSV